MQIVPGTRDRGHETVLCCVAGTRHCLVWLDTECRLRRPGDEARGRQAQMVQYLVFQQRADLYPGAAGSSDSLPAPCTRGASGLGEGQAQSVLQASIKEHLLPFGSGRPVGESVT